jgi:hypothetical protein
MLRLIARRLILPIAVHVILWIDRNWPHPDDLYDQDAPVPYWPAVEGKAETEDGDDDQLLDYVVRNHVQVPNDARDVAP